MVNLIQVMLGNVFTDFWYSIIESVAEVIPNYGLVIILFTVALKIVLTPIDYVQKKSMMENSEKQAELKPKIDKLKKQYKNDPKRQAELRAKINKLKKQYRKEPEKRVELKAKIDKLTKQYKSNTRKLNEKTMELYRKENYNLAGNCLGTLGSLVITIVVFLTLFFALHNISEDKIENQFLELQTAYVQAEQEGQDQEEAVLNRYDEIEESFLWIENIWRPDTRVSPIPDYETFLDETNVSSEEITETEYNEIVDILNNNNTSDWNGLYILTLLAAISSFLSQKVMKKSTSKPKKEDDKNNSQPSMNTGFLTVLLPALMVYITTRFNAAFSIYIVVNSIMTALISLILYNIINKMKKEEQEKDKGANDE